MYNSIMKSLTTVYIAWQGATLSCHIDFSWQFEYHEKVSFYLSKTINFLFETRLNCTNWHYLKFKKGALAGTRHLVCIRKGQ